MNTLILAWASWFAAFLLPAPTVEVPYFRESVPVTYDPSALRHDGLASVDERGIGDYLSAVEAQDWSPVLGSLAEKRAAWRLNDFLYARLVDATVARIGERLSENERRITAAHLLALDGFDIRLCYDADEVYVYALTDEPLYEVPIITERDRRFVNLTSALRPRDGVTRSLKFHPRDLAAGGRALSFDLTDLPRLPERLSERVYEFEYRGERLKLHAACDLSVVAWMRDYPIVAEGKYVETPLTPATAGRLHAELRPLLAGKTQREQLELLAAFTRGAFVYKEDRRGYGASKPMIADEVLHYPVSDCEDRSALYFSLVRDLLNLPVVAIAYNDHLSVAVASAHLTGARPFVHGGRTYHVCDPTGPAGSSEIGSPPYGYARRRFEVVASYVPTTT